MTKVEPCHALPELGPPERAGVSGAGAKEDRRRSQAACRDRCASPALDVLEGAALCAALRSLLIHIKAAPDRTG
jgi:hypothetical protein